MYLVPIVDAARHYLELTSPVPGVPSEAQLQAAIQELARRLPLSPLSNGGMATTRAALDSYIALKRYQHGI